jgi:hypothetical protein
MTYPPVLITWRDITTLNGWVSQDEVDDFVTDAKENIVNQVGFLYEEDENQIVILNSIFENKDIIGDVTKIPKDCIISVIRLTDLNQVILMSKKD